MMTRKHYIAIANMMSEVKKSGLLDRHDVGEKVFDTILIGLADVMAEDNKRFNRNLFYNVSTGMVNRDG